jgi:hypothetical protein
MPQHILPLRNSKTIELSRFWVLAGLLGKLTPLRLAKKIIPHPEKSGNHVNEENEEFDFAQQKI